MVHQENTSTRSNISPAKKALLESWKRKSVERTAQYGQETILPRRHGEERLPLSFAQQRLWFLDQLDAGSPAYIIPYAVRLRGSLEVAALLRAFEEVIARHEVLRTTFPTWQGEPFQRIASRADLAFRLLDLSHLPAERREQEARRLAQAEAACPFDLVEGPLLRCRLLVLAPQEQVLVVCMHHMISDGWSLDILVREVSLCYEAAVRGVPVVLPALSVQYADYALWQRSWMAGPRLEESLAYWRQQLAGVSALELPVDHPRLAAERMHGGQRQSHWLGAELREQVQALARREGVTLFMTLLAAFQVLLLRCSGEQDIAVGIPIASREQPEVQGLIGFFVNTLVLRTDLSGDPPFLKLLQQVRRVALEAYSHQDVPFEQVVEAVQSRREQGHSSLFQTTFSLQSMAHTLQLSDVWQSESFVFERSTTAVELGVMVTESERGLNISVQYDASRFDAATIQRLLYHWQTLLEGIVADPSKRIADLPLLSTQERELLLQRANAALVAYPTEVTVVQLFEEQVGRTAEAIALVCEDEQLTYTELNRRANQLAYYLRQQGVGPDVLVGVYLERTPYLLVALLGILKAGGAYVALDPAYPVGRIAFILHDITARVVLTQQSLLTQLPPFEGVTFALDQDWPQLQQNLTIDPQAVTFPQHAAYVLYTSGSTGQPKGVIIPHQALANFLLYFREELPLHVQDCWLAVTSISFDIAALELYLPLIQGARVGLVSRVQAADGVKLSRTLERCQCRFMQATPTTWTLLMAAGWRSNSAFHILCGGEQLPAELAKRLLEYGGSLRNMYGPTETTIWSSCACIEPNAERISIGHPIANTQFYVLDEHLQLVPVGVQGELYIGGRGLARGYWQRADLTAERFVPDPFSLEPGARLYRTGDRVRFMGEDGLLEYLGRVDAQVKLRGHRIELGEIEAALGQYPHVRQCVVNLQDIASADKRLIAYVVREKDSSISDGELRTFLKGKLPDYMLPAQFMMLDALPLTPNGKIDRKHLPLPDESLDALSGHEESRGPMNPVEELVLEIWQHVLKKELAGVSANFFEMGGHSLLATQIISQLQVASGIAVPLQTLFDAPTVAQFAKRVQGLLEGEQRVIPPMIAVQRRPDQMLPLSFAQQRLWFLDQLDAGSPAYIIPYAVRLRGSLEVAALLRAFEEVIARHEVLRTTFPTWQGEPFQRIASRADPAFRLLDLSHLPAERREQESRRLAQAEAASPFDLVGGPLLRCRLLMLTPHEWVLVVCMHHMISDGWSLDILVREISLCYEAAVRGVAAVLPALSVQYADYALWQRSWMAGPRLEESLAYWRQQLAGVSALELPVDHPRSAAERMHGGQRQSHWLGATLREQVQALARREGVTLFMTLLAAFQVLLLRCSGEQDIAVGTPIASREQPEVQGLIGFFVNTLVLRTDLSGDPSFLHVLARVRRNTLEAYAHHDVPFEKLVEELHPERNPGHTPFFRVTFTLQETDWPALKLDTLTNEFISINNGAAKVDLSLSILAHEGGLQCLWSYDSELFESATIVRITQHFQRLLEEIVANPDRAISSYLLLTEAERQRILVEWNETEVNYPTQIPAHMLFEAQVEGVPDAIALVSDDQQLTYSELNRRANQLAHYLKQAGVGPEIRVGVCMERSVEMIIGLLGILKAGGVYVPLDPTYPEERLGFMLKDAQVALLLTQQRLQERLIRYRMPLFYLDVVSQLEMESDANRAHEGSPDELAYIIYTSGSTGRPKGVLISQRGLSNLVQAQVEAFGILPGDKVIQFASLSFDASISEIMMALSSGAMLRVMPAGVPLAAEALAHFLREQGVTVATLPPAVLTTLPMMTMPELRVLIAAGEACPADVVARWAPGSHFFNAYGPTESSVCASLYRCTQVDRDPPPIGRPLANTRLYILSDEMQPVPVGVPGELYISGAGLARGYLHQAELTAQCFLPNPFSFIPGDRLYKTGDKACYLPDGRIKYAGRRDTQVKLRGFRIEPGEVEAALLTHPAVATAAVVVREDATGQQQLVAYVVPLQGQPLNSQELRDTLKLCLPEYMLPSSYLSLDALPLSPNGKVDRRLLTRQEVPSAMKLERSYAEPEPLTALEEILVWLWMDTLDLEYVGLDDNFFALGGHSLLVHQIIARIKELLHIDLPLRVFFETPTIAMIAKALLVEGGQQARIEKVAQAAREMMGLSKEEEQRLLEQQEERREA